MEYYYKQLMHLDEEHPAIQFLILHSSFCRECIGFELSISTYYQQAINIEWHSFVLNKYTSLDKILYGEFSITPEMDGWITNPPSPTENELRRLKWIASRRSLLNEAEVCAQSIHNKQTNEIIDRAIVILDAWEHSIRSRINQLDITQKTRRPQG